MKLGDIDFPALGPFIGPAYRNDKLITENRFHVEFAQKPRIFQRKRATCKDDVKVSLLKLPKE
jgi:hypothetical protein